MTSVDPDGDEEAEVGGHEGGFKVGEGFGGLFGGSQSKAGCGYSGEESRKRLTARKKSLMSCVMYTASPMYVKWNR